MNFSIIDFETATPWRGSVCAVGLTVVRNGKIVDEFYSLINPQEPIHKNLEKIHHISDADVASAPTFAEIWPQIVKLVGDYPLGSHNNEFDMAAIQSAVVHHDVRPANFKIFDTLNLFRAAFCCPHGCGLDEIATHYGYDLDHHNAGADASITAACVLSLANENNAAALADLLRNYNIPDPYSILFVPPYEYKAYIDKTKKHAKMPFAPAKTKDQPIKMTCGSNLTGCSVCITGELIFCSRDQAKTLIVMHGGKATTGISGKTNVLLVGEYMGYPEGYISSKHKEAIERIENGQNIEIWREKDFLQRIATNEEEANNDQ